MMTKFKIFESKKDYKIISLKELMNKYITDSHNDNFTNFDKKLTDLFVNKTCRFVGFDHYDNDYDEKEINGIVTSAWHNYYDDPEIDSEIILKVEDMVYDVVRDYVYVFNKKQEFNEHDPYGEEDWGDVNWNITGDLKSIYGAKISLY